METSRITRKADELKAKVPRPRRPAWQVGMIWFAGGMAIASLVGFFLDSRRGGARRHMAYDKAMATGRDMGDWSGKKVRHLRNKAMGTVAEMKSSQEQQAGGGYG